MPEITLTEAQYEQLEAVRADVEDAFVDGYGHARLEDAVDYLLDTYTPPDERGQATAPPAYDRIATAEYPDLQHVAAEVPDIPGSGIDADEMRGKLLSALGAEELAARLADGDAAENGHSVDDEASADAAPETDESDSPDEATDDADGGAEDDTPDEADPSPPADPLAGVNQLLRDHDDKWRKVDDGDEPYEVDLPDGTTEGVRTRDDVRQYLFRHY